MTRFKICSKCKIEKTTSEFNKHKVGKDGLRAYCKVCHRLEAKIWAKENPTKSRAIKDRYALKNKNKKNAKERLARSINPQKSRAATKRWRENNSEHMRFLTTRWRKNNPDKVLAITHKRIGRVRNAEGSFSAEEWADLKRKYGYTCLRCGQSEPKVLLSPDHIVPLARGGSNRISNIQPLCAKIDGSRKGNCQNIKGTKIADYRFSNVRAVTKQEN